jgi:hypothetical protein
MSSRDPSQDPHFQLITSPFSLSTVESVAHRLAPGALHTEGRRFESCIAHQDRYHPRFPAPMVIRRACPDRPNATAVPCRRRRLTRRETERSMALVWSGADLGVIGLKSGISRERR